MFSPSPQQQIYDADNVFNRMSMALSNRMEQRCADLGILFERASKKELESFFPLLIDNIFGPQSGNSWNLRSIFAETNSTEYNVLINFLRPLGSLFKLIYSLLQDPNIKYEFNLSFIPNKIKQMLSSSNIHPFYSDVLQLNTQTKQIGYSLLLNSFDYYIFHFTYYLINPLHQRTTSEDNWNTVYYNLCTEYLFHFFPTSIDYPQILPVINFYHGKNPMQTSQALQRMQKHHSNLLKSSLFSDPQVLDITTMHQFIDKHPRNEIWRSETILMAFIDFWLCNDQIFIHYDAMNISSQSVSQYLELPSADYIRIVRSIIKHMHAFASTSQFDNSALGELRKFVTPMLQARTYVFLKNLLDRWPLDESFRLVLELWLSFIQPWRYCHDLYIKRKQISNELIADKYASEEHLGFIAENLLCYVVIFQQLLPRFTRVDLSTPKNAQMLFRLTKVFNQPNLVPLIKRLERIIDTKNFSPPNQTFNLSTSGILPAMSPSTASNGHIFNSTQIDSSFKKSYTFTPLQEYNDGKYLNVIKQKLHELEGPNFVYKPLFTLPIANEVYELLNQIKTAEIKANNMIKTFKKREESAGFFSSLFYRGDFDVDNVTFNDRQKAVMFLRCSADYLLEIFDIKDFDNFDVTPELTENLSSMRDTSNILTRHSVRQRLHEIKYDGDPDLLPVRSHEIKFLVRMFYDLSTRINNKFSDVFLQYYYANNYAGRLSRNVLQSPEIVYKYQKQHGFSQRISYQLPPRLSLRRFASKRFLFYLFLLFFYGCFYSGYNFITFAFICSLFIILYLCLICIFKNPQVVMLNDTMEE